MEREVRAELAALVDRWCERRELKALALLLPAMTSVTSAASDAGHVADALREVRDRVRLPEEDAEVVERLLVLAGPRSVHP